MHNAIRPLSSILLIASAVACNGPTDKKSNAAAPAAEPVAKGPTHAELVHRGEELVTLGGCNDCHTPMKFDPKLGKPVQEREIMLSGHPENAPEPKGTPGEGDQAVIGATFTSFRAPFGVVYAANLTPDVETGIGSWTEEEFIATMHTGKERGTGRPILPPMPWQNLSAQPDENLRAIFAYLKSIPAVKNRVAAPRVPAEVIAAMGRNN
jgi:hypothetical protein